MSGKHTGPGRHPERRLDRPTREVRPKQHDTYVREHKAGGELVCTECGVWQRDGRWEWGPAPYLETEVKEGLCPACQRIRDRYPAGTIELPAGFLLHRDEIAGMIENAERGEKAEHPLERLMGVEANENGLVVTTTGIHLARRIANKLERRFHARARFRYPEEQELLFVDFEDPVV